MPIIGKAHIAYIAKDKVIGLVETNRIVQHFAKRPQAQERMTMQIAEELNKYPDRNVAVIIEAKHLCVSRVSTMIHPLNGNLLYGGKFLNEQTKQEFLKYLS